MQESHIRTSLSKLFSKLGFAIILIFVISFAVRVIRLDFYSLWHDEFATVLFVQAEPEASLLTRFVDNRGSESLHPLYYVILSVWTKLAGNSAWALRFPSVVFGSCAVLVYAFLLYRVTGRKAFGFSLLLIVAPFLVWYSRDARPYALIMLLTGLHLLFYLSLLGRPRSKTYLAGLIITGILSIYSGIFIGMLLAAELSWSLIRRRRREVAILAAVLLLALPIVWQGYRTRLDPKTDRYCPIPTGMNAIRILGFPQEFLVARSLGPTPDEVRRFPLNQVIRQKSLAIGVETLAIICILVSLVGCIRSWRRSSASDKRSVQMLQTLGFIAIAVCLQAALLIAITGYQMNTRHICFLFGPFFVLGTYPIVQSRGYMPKILFIAPLLVLWTWSSGNQLFNPSYVPEDFKNTARIINNDHRNACRVVALCHGSALPYYGVKKPLISLMGSPQVTVEKLKDRLKDESRPAWLVLSRPWDYPNFHAKDLGSYFQVLQTEELPGINMWLLLPSN